MCKVFGYCRISRRTQNIERQVRNIKTAYPDAVIITEAYTGTKMQGREKFERLCKTVKKGDTIIFDSVSRMSRNAAEGFAQYQVFFDQGAHQDVAAQGADGVDGLVFAEHDGGAHAPLDVLGPKQAPGLAAAADDAVPVGDAGVDGVTYVVYGFAFYKTDV